MTTHVAADEGSNPSASPRLRYLSLIPGAIVVAALYFGRPVLLPLTVAVLLAFALAPLVGRLRRIGAGRVLSVLVAAVFSIGVMSGIGVFVTIKTFELADQLPRYQSNLVDKIRSIRGTTVDTSVVERAASLLKNLRDQVSGVGKGAPSSSTRRLAARPSGSEPVQVEIQEADPAPMELAATLIGPLLGFLAAAGIIVIFVIFILLHKEDIRDRFIRLAGSGDIQRTTLLLDDGAERLGYFLLTQAAINAAFGIFIGLGLWLIGVPNPTLWGVCVMIFRFVPYIGVPLAAVLPVILALSVDPGWSMVLWTVALFAVAETVVGQAVEPWLFGHRMGLSSLAVVVSAVFWLWLWGPLGLLLSTPLTMCLVVLGRHVEHLRFLDVLLGDRPSLAPEEALYIRMLGDDADEAAAEAESFLKENSLCRYYDEVALKALAIGQSDVNRGALDHDRALKIRNTIQALVQNLCDVETENRTEAHANRTSTADNTVLCIGGGGPLDEAAALLLMNLLEKAGVKARLVSKSDVSAANLYRLDVVGAKAACVCYLDVGNFVRARYLLRRVRRHIPEAVTIAAFWGYPQNDSRASEAMGCDVVTSLDGAVPAVLAAINPGVPRREAA